MLTSGAGQPDDHVEVAGDQPILAPAVARRRQPEEPLLFARLQGPPHLRVVDQLSQCGGIVVD
jgi:hypothetical protein